MSKNKDLEGFDYQTRESTLLGAVEDLRMPGMDDLPDYMETFSGFQGMYPTQSNTGNLTTFEPMGVVQGESESDDDDETPQEEPEDEVGGLDIFDDGDEEDDMAAGFFGFGQFEGLSADFFDPSFSGFGAVPAANSPEFTAIKQAHEEYLKQYGGRPDFKLISIEAFRDFKGFGRQLGSRGVNARVQADITREDGTTGKTTAEIRVPASIALAYRDSIPNAPPAAYFQVVLERGQAMTDQEIEAELARVKKQANVAAMSNIGEGQSRTRGGTTAGKEAKAKSATKFAAAMKKNVASAAKYGWRVNRDRYSDGPGDAQLAVDTATFQQYSKTPPPFDGIIGKNTINSILTIQKVVAEQGPKAKIDGSIMDYIYAIEVPGSPSLRARGFAPDTAKKAAAEAKTRVPSGAVADNKGRSGGGGGGGGRRGGGGGGGGYTPPGPGPAPGPEPVPGPTPPAAPKTAAVPWVLGGVAALAAAYFAFRPANNNDD